MAQAHTMERIKVAGSRVATTATRTFHDAMEKAGARAGEGWNARAQTVAKYVAMFALPVIGMGIAHAVDRNHNARVETNKKEVLAKYYRNQIGAQLRIDPSKVNASHLDLINPNSTLGTAVAKVKTEKNDANRASALSSSAAAAATAIIPLPAVGTFAHMAASTGVHVGGSVAGSLVASAFNKDILHSQDVMEHLDDKTSKGQAITAADIVTLRISKDENMQRALKKQNGLAFHKMNEAQQRAVLVSMPGMQDAAQVAADINSGHKELQDALMAPAAQPGSWAQRVGGSRAVQASFVDHHRARLAAANDNQGRGFV